MKTLANKHFVLHDDLPCGHYGVAVKATHKCVACEVAKKEGLELTPSGKAGIAHDQHGGFFVSTYTTEDVIYFLLVQRYGEDRVKREVRLGGSAMRADIVLGSDCVIEFDGPSHYTNARTIVSDAKKDALCATLGMRIARVPYWVQLDMLMAEHLEITDKFYVTTSFPHGWVSADVFPASFCEAGVARFYRDLAALPKQVARAVVSSLHDCCVGRDVREVWTEAQRRYVESLVDMGMDSPQNP